MKPAFNNVILDLDGTLTDSAEGVYNAIGYALKEIGREVPRSQLRFMLGPPIIEGFTQLLGGDRALAMKCVSIERVYSNARGIYEGRLFPGVHDMLEKLKAAGCRLAVATCRTMPSTVKVLAHYGLNGYFDAVEAPAQQDLNFRGKAGLIESILRRFGAQAEISGTGVTVRGGALRGIRIDAAQIPDLIPVLAVTAAGAQGETVIENAARLRLKESDRLQSTAELLRRLGCPVTELPDGLIIKGGQGLTGGTVSACGDHRIAMSAAVAAMLCTGPVTVTGAESVEKSYPRFWADWEHLKGDTL